MGTYHGVNAVKANGNKLQIPRGTKPDCPDGCYLVAIVNNGVWAIAPDVTDPQEFKQFYDSYSQGNWLSFDVYSVKNEIQCPDEGRVMVI